MQVVIPEGILSDDTLGNVARLEPLGGKYDVQYRMFNKGKGDIVLKPFSIRYISDIMESNFDIKKAEIIRVVRFGHSAMTSDPRHTRHSDIWTYIRLFGHIRIAVVGGPSR